MGMQERRFTITLGQLFWTWILLAVVNFFYAAGVSGSFADAFAFSFMQLIAVSAVMTSSTVVEKIEIDEA